jgi:pyruvate dehydrogenase E1 component alpha subunit
MATWVAAPPRDLERGRLLELYRVMVRIRAFEEAGLAAHQRGLVPGALHPSIGQEAVAAGIGAALRPDDLLFSTHRGHGHCLAKGADPAAMMQELLGRAGGCCGGKGGSMHIADARIGMLGANGVVAANITIAAGAAHALRLTGQDRIVACLFGDGAVNRGPFLEGLNWARIHDLPLLLVCEDNGYAATSQTTRLTGGPGSRARAESLGLPARAVDGNDVLAVDAAARDLALRIRAGGGPQFLLAATYRLAGHTAADAGAYRSPAELAARWQDEPLRRCADRLQAAGIAPAALEALAQAAAAEMAAALAAAMAAPWPAPAAAFADVQDLGAPRPRGHG